eukprot:202652-Chlamydomonas_euryale.AAC.1
MHAPRRSSPARDVPRYEEGGDAAALSGKRDRRCRLGAVPGGAQLGFFGPPSGGRRRPQGALWCKSESRRSPTVRPQRGGCRGPCPSPNARAFKTSSVSILRGQQQRERWLDGDREMKAYLHIST